MQQTADSEIEVPFDAALSERYLVYALSTITARSLPDVRDGLKPVHRRLLSALASSEVSVRHQSMDEVPPTPAPDEPPPLTAKLC